MTDMQFLMLGMFIGTFAGMGWGLAAGYRRGQDEDK